MNNKAFTLVELIVVITILAILGTIAFISLQGYSRDARDSVRITDLSNISKQLELMLVKAGQVYIPENKVDITASGTVILYQGEMGLDTLSKLRVYNGGLDKINNAPYTYSTTKNLKQYELMGFLEGGNIAYNQVPSPGRGGLGRGIITQANATTDLTNRFPVVKGGSIGIILNPTTNQPINLTGVGVDIVNTNTTYKILLNNSSSGSIIGTGNILFTKFYNQNTELLKNKDLAKFDSSLVLYFDMETTISIGGYIIALKDFSNYGNNGYCSYSGSIVNCGSSTGPKFINSNLKKFMNFKVSGVSNIYDLVISNDSPSLDITTNELTISMWYRLDKNISDMYFVGPSLLDKRNYLIGGYAAYLEKNYDRINMTYTFPSSSEMIIGNKNNNFLQPNQWYFYTGVKTQNGLFLYNNGELLDSKVVTQSMQSSSNNLLIGTYFEGGIDEVRVYDRALSTNEVRALYNSSK